MAKDKKNAHKYLKVGLAAVALLIAGGIAFAAAHLPELIGREIQNRGRDTLGREVAMDPLEVRWHWSTPRIILRNVSIANIEGAKDPQMVEIAEADFRIRIWKLLYGRTEIPAISLKNPIVILEKKKDGSANWRLPALSEGNALAEAALPDDRHDFPVIGVLNVTDGKVTYRDETKGLDVALNISTAEGESGDEDGGMRIEGEGTLQGRKFGLTARGGSLELMRDSSKPYPLDMDLRMGATRASLNGTFTDPVRMQGIDARLELSGNNLADLFYLTGIPLPPTPVYKISGALGKEDMVWSFKDFSGKVGDSDLSGDLTYDIGGERSFLKGSLYSKKMDIADLGGFIGMVPVPGTNRMTTNSSRLLPDVPLDLKRLRAADLDVTLKADRLVAPDLPFNGMNVRFLLNNGLLKLDPMHLSLAQGKAAGTLTLDGRQKVPRVAAKVDLSHLQLARFFAGTRFEEETNGTIGGQIELAGRGLSTAEVLGGSDGRVMALMSGGQVSLLLVEASDIDIAEAVPLFLGEDRTTQIRCAVADFDVSKGLLTSRIFVLDTSDTNLKGDVKIDLRSETIDAVLDARPKDPSPLSLQSPILVRGSLKRPKVMLEPVRTGLRAAGAAALGAVLTPLAAILPFIETGGGKDSNCRALINTAQNN